VTCAEFETWLDAGMPETGAGKAHGHGAGCRRCATALAAAEELETLLLTRPGPAPPGFTQNVMMRLEESGARVPALPVWETLPWWIRAAAEPAAVLAMLVAALLAWRFDMLWSLTGPAVAGLGQWVQATLASWAGIASSASGIGTLGRPAVQLGLELALMCLALAWFPGLYRWTSRLTARAAAARSR